MLNFLQLTVVWWKVRSTREDLGHECAYANIFLFQNPENELQERSILNWSLSIHLLPKFWKKRWPEATGSRLGQSFSLNGKCKHISSVFNPFSYPSSCLAPLIPFQVNVKMFNLVFSISRDPVLTIVEYVLLLCKNVSNLVRPKMIFGNSNKTPRKCLGDPSKGHWL
jgi:hypothetical protein